MKTFKISVINDSISTLMSPKEPSTRQFTLEKLTQIF